MRSCPRLIGFTAVGLAGRFLVPTCARKSSPSLRYVFTSRIQLSSRPLPFRVPSPPIALPASPEGSASCTCLDSGPHRDFTSARPLVCERFPSLAYVTSSGYRNLSTVFSARTLAGLFHPAAASRAFLFRVFSSRAATSPRRREPTPMLLFPAHSRPKPCPSAVSSASRLLSA